MPNRKRLLIRAIGESWHRVDFPIAVSRSRRLRDPPFSLHHVFVVADVIATSDMDGPTRRGRQCAFDSCRYALQQRREARRRS